MNRTLRAALVAFLVGLVFVGGVGAFLGVAPMPAVVAGLVAGILFGGLILAAARRSQGFHDDTPRRDER